VYLTLKGSLLEQMEEENQRGSYRLANPGLPEKRPPTWRRW